MDPTALTKTFQPFSTGVLCNAHPQVQALGAALQPLFAGIKLIGPAKTARTSPGHNTCIHHAVHTASAGEVLVVDSGDNRSFGPFGDILATCCRNKGVEGLVINSTVRDRAELRKLEFPVFCLGANPMATAKVDPGQIDIDITCGDASISPGDLIFGDDDGVVVVPRSLIEEVAEKASAVIRKEEDIMRRMAKGETTYEIFGLNT